MLRYVTLFLALYSFTAYADESVPVFEKQLSDYDYPFKVNELAFSSQGLELMMAYLSLPAQSAKPTVTLFHGKNFIGAYFTSIATRLHQQGYGMLMPDQIDFGKSSPP